MYYLRMEKDYQWLAYPHKLTVELGSYVDSPTTNLTPTVALAKLSHVMVRHS